MLKNKTVKKINVYEIDVKEFDKRYSYRIDWHDTPLYTEPRVKGIILINSDMHEMKLDILEELGIYSTEKIVDFKITMSKTYNDWDECYRGSISTIVLMTEERERPLTRPRIKRKK